ncbi:MAG: hypothetical protein EOO39_17745 [Cytophagaceae bacterium]|nr:MAG: hypothetical protein EOO39_17745 [Cytophagaceae bacterium]
MSNKLLILSNTRLLLPHRFRLIGWIVFILSAILGLANMYADFHVPSFNVPSLNKSIHFNTDTSQTNLVDLQNLTDEIAAIGVIIGLLLIGFSREKTEDEMISQLRLEALQWSVYANYLVLAIAIVSVYDSGFFVVMIYNMFTVLLVFIGRFRWLIYRNNQLMVA